MKGLILGCSGQDGTLLSDLLLKSGWQVFGTHPRGTHLDINHKLHESENNIAINVEDSETIDFISDLKPNVIFYLAGITSVAESWENPDLAFDINTVSYSKILKFLEKSKLNTRVIYASSVEIFKNSIVINEESPMTGTSPYAASKIAATQLGRLYREQRQLKISNAILGNHESYLRDSRFVTGKIAAGVASIKLGLTKKIILGNIDVTKNWSAAEDIVSGLKKFAEKDISDDIIFAYPKSTALTHLIELAFKGIGVDEWQPYVESDLTLYRKNEDLVRQYDSTKAKKLLDWQAETTPEVWIKQMVEYQIAKLSK